MLALAGDVAGRRILDASAGKLEIARRQLGSDAELLVADLSDRLPLADNTFDDVVASLVLHYLRDWGPTLIELRRVLKPGGRVLVSVDHPFAIHAIRRQEGHPRSYFDIDSWAEEWTVGGHTARMSCWNRPLHALTHAVPQPVHPLGHERTAARAGRPSALPGGARSALHEPPLSVLRAVCWVIGAHGPVTVRRCFRPR